MLSMLFLALYNKTMVHNMEFEHKKLLETASGTQSIGRAAKMLRFVGARAAQGAGLAELVDDSGLTKPTCRRILLGLMDAGLIDQEALSRRYFLGPEVYALGVIAAESINTHRHALDSVARLAQRTGDAAFLHVRRGLFVICLHREDGSFPLRSLVLTAGERHPLGAGAGPISILASLADVEVETALAANRRLFESKYPRLTPSVVLDLVRETREKGYTMNRGLVFAGSWGMGMAVREPNGRVESCLSLAAVESRMQADREAQLAAWLGEEVQIVEKRLADRAKNKRNLAKLPSHSHHMPPYKLVSEAEPWRKDTQ